MAAASAILSPSCWIEAFDESSTSRADLSALHLVAWSLNPNAIPKEKMVAIAEPDLLPDDSILDHGEQVFSKPSSSRESREALCYNVIIHIHVVEDLSSVTGQVLPFAPSSDDSGFGRLPESDYGESGPRHHSLLHHKAWRSRWLFPTRRRLGRRSFRSRKTRELTCILLETPPAVSSGTQG